MKKCKDEESISFFTQSNCGAWFQTTNFSPLHMSRWPPTSHTATKFCLFTTSLLHSSSDAAENHPALNKEQADFAAHPWGLGTRERILSVQGWRWLSGTHGLLSPAVSDTVTITFVPSGPQGCHQQHQRRGLKKHGWLQGPVGWIIFSLVKHSAPQSCLSVWDFNHHEGHAIQKIQECNTVLHWYKHHHYRGHLPTGFSSISRSGGRH